MLCKKCHFKILLVKLLEQDVSQTWQDFNEVFENLKIFIREGSLANLIKDRFYVFFHVP